MLSVLQKATVKLCTNRNLSHRPHKHTHKIHGTIRLQSGFPALNNAQSVGSICLSLPVLVDEALILSVGIDGRHSRRYLPLDPYHFMMQESGDVKILLEYLLSGSEFRKGT